MLCLLEEVKVRLACLLHALEYELKAGSFTSVVFANYIAFKDCENIVELILLENALLVLSCVQQAVYAGYLATVLFKIVELLLLWAYRWKLKCQMAWKVFVEDAQNFKSC